MKIFFILTFIITLAGCTTVDVVKEVAKTTSSIKTSVEKISSKHSNEKNKKIVENDINPLEEKISINNEKKILEVEKKKEKKITKQQKKIVEINFFNKTLNEIGLNIENNKLSRLDGNTKIIRFDNDFCRLFLFFNAKDNTQKIKHFEIRDLNGNLINNKKKLEACYNNFLLT